MPNSFYLTAELHRLRPVFIRVASLALFAAGVSFADIQPTYNVAGSQSPNVALICAGTTTCIVGTEDFSSWTGGSFTTDYGTSNRITGSYSGYAKAFAADQYGGAGGTGTYAEVFGGRTETIQLSTAPGVPGVNYFGLWFSALDNGNLLQFYNGNDLVYSFTPDVFRTLVGACNGSDLFCGNPNASFLGQDPGEQFAYLNFFDTGGFFNKVVFTQTGGGGFESDNDAVGYLNPITVSGTLIPTPEPGYWWLSALGFASLAAVAFLRRNWNVRAATSSTTAAAHA